MPRKVNNAALERARKHRESQKRKRSEIAQRARTQTIHEALPAAARVNGRGGPLIDSSGGIKEEEDDDDDGAGEGSPGGVTGGGVVLRKPASEGGQVILQRLSQSSKNRQTECRFDAKKLKQLKVDLDVALEVDERVGVEPVALGLRVDEVKIKGEGRGCWATHTRLCGFTDDHLQTEPAANAFLVALRDFARSYVDPLEPLFHEEFRELLEQRQHGFDQLQEAVGQAQVNVFTPQWTAVRIMDEGSRTAWQSWVADATPSLLIPLGPPVILELEYGSVELKEGHVCLFDASLKHRIVLSTLSKRSRRYYVAADGTLERPWCVCAHACAAMVGRDDGEEDEEVDELEEARWVADEKKLLKNPPEVRFKYKKYLRS